MGPFGRFELAARRPWASSELVLGLNWKVHRIETSPPASTASDQGLLGNPMNLPTVSEHSHVRRFQVQASKFVACEQALLFGLFRAGQETRSLKRRLIIL